MTTPAAAPAAPAAVANAAKAGRYFTGKPCKHGHVAERFLSCGICVECNRLFAANRREKYPEQTRACVKAAYEKYGEKYAPGKRTARAKWKLANPEWVKASNHKQYVRKGSAYWRAARSKRRAAERRQVPPWANVAEIERIYRECPTGHHVDHVIPLRGKLVSGLHVETNLQYLPARANQRKHNRFNPEEWVT